MQPEVLNGRASGGVLIAVWFALYRYNTQQLSIFAQLLTDVPQPSG